MSDADPVDLHDLVRQWGREFALERELAGLASDPEATWVPLAEAERRSGVSRSTLRAWYRTGQVASRLTPGPHGLQRLVPLDLVLDKASRSPRTGLRPPAPETGAVVEAAVEAEEAPPMSTPEALVRLAELAKEAATERAEAAERRAVAAEAALQRAIERAAAAEAELRLLRP
ncbi:MAG TPA: hypothetical protein VM933_03395 [Acidimicrobiales bacterium]|nr:hypothetical protein [Acidimicrobiales bacterium]